jgi:H+/Cl- antiporter ClcA
LTFINYSTNPKTSPPIKLAVVTIVIGVASGLIGMTLALLLHYIQHLAYGYSSTHVISAESFFQGTSASSDNRRVLVLIFCGLIAGFGWFILYKFSPPLISISESIKTCRKMPTLGTLGHILLQITTIALGSPLGREVAPREGGAMFAYWFANKTQLKPNEIKLMVACGAGAGLAAVYNVPLGGAVFVMEVLLCNFNLRILLPAFTTCAIAVIVSWWGLGNQPTYSILSNMTIDTSIIVWSIFTGPIFGLIAYWFITIANKQRVKATHDWRIVIACLVNFTMIGLLAVYFPVLLGNGKSVAQLEFSGPLTIGLSALVLALRCGIVWGSLRAGASGGLLTPSVANGALLGIVLGGIWNGLNLTSSLPMEAFALIGASAFLAAAQRMPLTAVILILEFTQMPFIFFIPLMLAICGAMAMVYLIENIMKKDKH